MAPQSATAAQLIAHEARLIHRLELNGNITKAEASELVDELVTFGADPDSGRRVRLAPAEIKTVTKGGYELNISLYVGGDLGELELAAVKQSWFATFPGHPFPFKIEEVSA